MKKSDNWVQIKFYFLKLYGLQYHFFETENKEAFLIYHSPSFYGLFNFPFVHQWQKFKKYPLTKEETLRLKVKVDFSSVNQREFFFQKQFATSMVVRKTLTPIIMPIIIILVTPLMYILSPLKVASPFLIFIVGRVLTNNLLKNKIEKLMNTNLDEKKYEYIHLKIRKRGILGVLCFYALPSAILVIFIFSIEKNYGWVMFVAALFAVLMTYLHSVPFNDSKMYIKNITED